MAQVFAFRAVRYAGGGADVSALIAPPYDVLDAAGKARLLAREPRNVVGIDLPHTPAKELGPPSAYVAAAESYRALLESGVLERLDRAAIFAYRQRFGKEKQAHPPAPSLGEGEVRHGMACCVETVPFGARPGGGVLPHEETFSGPKEDRLALMKATRTQLSPIFGLHADERGAALGLIKGACAARSPDQTGRTDDGTLHEVWTIDDAPTIAAYRAALAGEDIFIADGHHRYNTALNYLNTLGAVAADHPARRCMMVLVGMSDPGLAIWPTHRVLGGMSGYTFDRFCAALAGSMVVAPVQGGLETLGMEMAKVRVAPAAAAENVLGFYDFASGRAAVATMATPDPLADRFADKPRAWRELDVALIQHLIVERVCEPVLNGGNPVKWAFPHTIAEVGAIGEGAETGAGGGSRFAQVAVIVRPTPLEAVKEISRAGVLMPQKSTFFYPKLATGLFMNPLE